MYTELAQRLREAQLDIIMKREAKQKACLEAYKTNSYNIVPLLTELLQLEHYETCLQQLIEQYLYSLEDNIRAMLSIQHLLTNEQAYKVKKLAHENNIYHKELIFSEDKIIERKQRLNDNYHDSQWTDEAQEDMEVLMVDDEIAKAMEESEDYEPEKQEVEKPKEYSEESLDELEQEFVINGKSDHQKLLRGHNKFVVSLAVDNSKLVSGGGDDLLNIYDLKMLEEGNELQPIKSIKEDETVSMLKFSHSCDYLVSVTVSSLTIYDCKTLESRRAELSDCRSLAMHPLGNLCAAGAGHEVHLYNLNNCTLYNSFYTDREVTLVDFAPGGKYIVVGGKGQLRVIQPKTEETKRISGHNFHQEYIVCLDFKDNLTLTGSVDGYACLSDWQTATVHARTELHTNSVENVLFYNNLFLTGCVDGFVRWYDVNTVKKLNNYQFGGAVTKMLKLKYSPLVCVTSFTGEICLMDPRAYNERKMVSAGSTIHDVVQWQHGLFVSCEDSMIKYFDLRLI